MNWKLTLPYTTIMLTIRGQLISPWIPVLLQSTSDSILPLHFSMQTLTTPLTTSLSIIPRHMCYRMIHSVLYIGVRTFWTIPYGTFYNYPPGRSLYTLLAFFQSILT